MFTTTEQRLPDRSAGGRKPPPKATLHRLRAPFLALLLGFVLLLFASLLVVVWVATDRADPVILDERGAPR